MSPDRRGRSFAADPIVEAPAPLPDAWVKQLVSCVVDENVGLPDTALVTYRDPDHQLLTATGISIGTPLKISVATAQAGPSKVRLFTGEVTALELDHDNTGSFTVIRAHSKVHRLQRGRKVVAFRNLTTAAIVKKIAAGAGLPVGKVEAAPVTHKQISQPNVSDWEFLQYLAGESGAHVRVDEKGMLQFVKPKPASSAPAPSTRASANPMVLEYGANLLALRAVLTGADGASKVEVRGWNVNTKAPLVASKPSVRSDTFVPGLSPSKASMFGKTAQITVADTPYRTQAETRHVAGSVAASVSAGFGEFEAVVEGNPGLRAGKPVTLGNVGADFSGRYTATAVHHVLEPVGGYRTTVVVSASPDRSLLGLASGGGAPARPARMPGLAIGVVTNVREVGGQQRGWVQLKFPWLDEQYETDWVRTVQWGGKGGGGVFSPEVNDEVLVGFEQGLLDSPYVIGGLYNGVDKPSKHDVPLVDKTSGKIQRRSLVSRSGHRLELLDTRTGVSGIRLASGNKRLEVKLDERLNQIDVTVYRPGGRSPLTSMTLTPTEITLDAGMGTLNLNGRTVNINSKTAMNIDARTTMNISAKTGVTVTGGTAATVKAAVINLN
ncbi:VgrG-related protein [Streptomyces sp. P9(2023)]|uniref:VgrG-related protein n=1 Tax=Streptomyces sp. P9(2023) TaxID=3064394 RepID=UPI0028F41AA5|nr:VgrG-related protein [Streptomyces sp. P9(2023)]MDT9689858.1 VgrG-related protein [Streptomyces sp. P9(2023)]